ncbi:MAG: lspA [Acidimicrobiales bacterium]|nr:lspA [Acidimicrobiales bacterium]
MDAPPPSSTDPTPPTAPAGRTERRPRRFGIVLGVAVVIVAVDQVSKQWALNRLSAGRMVDVIGSLRFNLAFNTGTAFSFGSGKGMGPWISVLAIVVVAALAVSGSSSRFAVGAVATGLIAGGAVGNLADRAFRGDQGFLHGAVVDFVDLQWWPVFNAADSAIVVGAILLVLASLRHPAA